jgi:hypothetical protein
MKVAETGGTGTSSSSLSPCAGGDLQQQQKRNNQLILVFISFVFVFCFGFFLLFVRSGFYFSSSRFRIRFFLQIGLLYVSSSSPLLQVAAELWVSMAVQLLVAGLCKGELVDGSAEREANS